MFFDMETKHDIIQKALEFLLKDAKYHWCEVLEIHQVGDGKQQ